MLSQLFDGRLVETVGIPADADGGGRLTVCVSSQVATLQLSCSFSPPHGTFSPSHGDFDIYSSASAASL